MSKEARDLIAAIREVALAELGENAEGAAVANLGSTSAHTIAVPVTVVVAETHIPAELVTSFAAKADQAAVSSMKGALETRLSNLETKLNALLTSLRDSHKIAAS